MKAKIAAVTFAVMGYYANVTATTIDVTFDRMATDSAFMQSGGYYRGFIGYYFDLPAPIAPLANNGDIINMVLMIPETKVEKSVTFSDGSYRSLVLNIYSLGLLFQDASFYGNGTLTFQGDLSSGAPTAAGVTFDEVRLSYIANLTQSKLITGASVVFNLDGYDAAPPPPAVPEPGGLAMVISGILLLGLKFRLHNSYRGDRPLGGLARSSEFNLNGSQRTR